jgi:hypothetical protein
MPSAGRQEAGTRKDVGGGGADRGRTLIVITEGDSDKFAALNAPN